MEAQSGQYYAMLLFEFLVTILDLLASFNHLSFTFTYVLVCIQRSSKNENMAFLEYTTKQLQSNVS